MTTEAKAWYGSPKSDADMPEKMDESDRKLVLVMHGAVCDLSLWEEMKQSPPDGVGFMWWNATHVSTILNHKSVVAARMSGAISAQVLRHIHYIAVHGWVKYVEYMNSTADD